jgi:hypothetical protein
LTVGANSGFRNAPTLIALAVALRFTDYALCVVRTCGGQTLSGLLVAFVRTNQLIRAFIILALITGAKVAIITLRVFDATAVNFTKVTTIVDALARLTRIKTKTIPVRHTTSFQMFCLALLVDA